MKLYLRKSIMVPDVTLNMKLVPEKEYWDVTLINNRNSLIMV